MENVLAVLVFSTYLEIVKLVQLELSIVHYYLIV